MLVSKLSQFEIYNLKFLVILKILQLKKIMDTKTINKDIE